MKKHFLLTLFLACLYCFSAQAQSVYHLKYQLGKTDTTTYEAFFVLFDGGTGFARVKFLSKQTNQPVMVETELQEIIRTNEEGEADDNKVGYVGIKPTFIKGNDSTIIAPATYWFKRNAGDTLDIWGVSATDYMHEPEPDSYQFSKLIGKTDLKKSFVLQFYDKSDPVYKKVFENISRGTQVNRNITMHMIIVANTNDKSIGESCALDMKEMDKVFRNLAGNMKIDFKPVVISGATYNKQNLIEAVNKLTPGKEDIVVFYYTGHGFRKPPAHGFNAPTEQTNYPFMDLRANPKQDYMIESMTIDSVYRMITRKGARFNLVMSDCCNSLVEATNVVAKPIGRSRGSGLDKSMQNMEAMFMSKQPKSILASAADVQQLATSNNKFGGFFSYFFKSNLELYLSPYKMNPSWEQLLEDAKKQTIDKARHTYCDTPRIVSNICKQTPIFSTFPNK